jgi:trk system potassium uptake protein TrkA
VKIVIVGCGRVGAAVAESYAAAGHDVVIVDSQTSAFDRLTDGFSGRAVRGDGTDEDVLRKAGTEGADVFIALTEGDNRNVMAAQLAAEALGVGRAIAKLNDPVRAAAYADLGIATLCRTGLMLDAVNDYLGVPPSGLPGMQAPTGHHPGAPHHDDPAGGPLAAPAGSAPGEGAPGEGAPGAVTATASPQEA